MFGSTKKVNLQISFFSATITKFSGQVKMEEGEVKEVRQKRWWWRKDRGRRDMW